MAPETAAAAAPQKARVSKSGVTRSKKGFVSGEPAPPAAAAEEEVAP